MQEVRGSTPLSSTKFKKAKPKNIFSTTLQKYRPLLIIGTIEISFGLITLISVLGSVALGFNTKTPNVLFFVIITATLSALIGIGILRFNVQAYHLLLYFSSVIIFSKFMILLDIIQLNGALETAIPSPLKNSISILYHGLIIFFLSRKDVRNIFKNQ